MLGVLGVFGFEDEFLRGLLAFLFVGAAVDADVDTDADADADADMDAEADAEAAVEDNDDATAAAPLTDAPPVAVVTLPLVFAGVVALLLFVVDGNEAGTCDILFGPDSLLNGVGIPNAS